MAGILQILLLINRLAILQCAFMYTHHTRCSSESQMSMWQSNLVKANPIRIHMSEAISLISGNVVIMYTSLKSQPLSVSSHFLSRWFSFKYYSDDMMNCGNIEYNTLFWMDQIQRLLCFYILSIVFHCHDIKSQIKIQSEQNERITNMGVTQLHRNQSVVFVIK